jgi:hypothetical protein
VSPGATRDGCDGIDTDCDGLVDEDPDREWFADEDGDGFGDAARGGALACTPAPGRVTNGRDCDDGRATVFPGAPEVCDAVDSDCDGDLADGEGEAGWADVDGDGLGDEAAPTRACDAVDNTWDCDDADPRLPVWLAATGSDRGDGTAARPVATLDAAWARVSGPTKCVLVDSDGGDEARVTLRSSWIVGPGERLDVRATGRYEQTLWVPASGSVVTVLAGGRLRIEGVTLLEGHVGSRRVVDGSERPVGGAVYSDGGEVELVGMRFLGNRLPTGDDAPLGSDLAAFGGGVSMVDVVSAASSDAMYLEGVDLRATRVRTNATTGTYAWWVRDSVVTGENLLFYRNVPDGDAVMRVSDSDVVLTNVTMADEGGSPWSSAGGRATLVNVDFARNADTPRFGGEYTLGYANLWPAPSRRIACEACTYLDPLHASAYDYRPAATSPLRDAGDPSIRDADGGRSDVGAYGGPNGGW